MIYAPRRTALLHAFAFFAMNSRAKQRNSEQATVHEELTKSWRAPHFYEVHGCSTFPIETDGNAHLELARRLAQSETELNAHRSVLLSHLECLGLRMNTAKSSLLPSQRISFLGAVIDSAQMRAWPSNKRILAIQRLVSSFRVGTKRPLRTFQRMLGLMASASSALPLGMLQMRPLQYWLKPQVPPQFMALKPSSYQGGPQLHQSPGSLESGVSLGIVSRRMVVTTDASNTAWGALCEGKPASGSWTSTEGWLHINCQEMLAVLLAFKTFLPHLAGHHVLVRMDNTTVVSYINRQNGLRTPECSGVFCLDAPPKAPTKLVAEPEPATFNTPESTQAAQSISQQGGDLCLIDLWSADPVPSQVPTLEYLPFPPVPSGHLDAPVPYEIFQCSSPTSWSHPLCWLSAPLVLLSSLALPPQLAPCSALGFPSTSPWRHLRP
ncbi:hypothetical protein PO909_033538 [Leuciscus waleckii]